MEPVDDEKVNHSDQSQLEAPEEVEGVENVARVSTHRSQRSRRNDFDIEAQGVCTANRPSFT
jgi:hypothetical protein